MKRSKLMMIGVLAFLAIALNASSAMAADKDRQENVTVSFGEWDPNDPDLLPAEVPLDRFRGDPAMGRGNNHELIPNTVKIKAGDSVNFIISGGHIVTVYDDGTKLDQIDKDTTEPPPAPTSAGGVLSDSNGRIYRGADFTGRRDGVEVVKFSEPGTYLVICARKNHFFNPDTQQFEMFGFVRVLPGK